jgi:hypothetical protein
MLSHRGIQRRDWLQWNTPQLLVIEFWNIICADDKYFVMRIYLFAEVYVPLI